MSDPKNQDKHLEIDDLEIQKETLQELDADVRGGMVPESRPKPSPSNACTVIACTAVVCGSV